MDFHLRKFDQLFVVSDLHMGGEKTAHGNFQVFNKGKRLAAFIRSLVGKQAESKKDFALVLNGDIFDSLAEKSVPGYIAFDVDTIERMMNRLYDDASFKPVWDALAEFVRKPHCHLIIVVGNHDIELALPPVVHSIRQRLCDGDPDANSRLHFSAHGAGFSCFVGKARVFCTHGNELDKWNYVDYTALGQLANAMNAGRRIDEADWRPNAGTRLVVDAMNHVKKRYPFVDLLKPENAALSTVLAYLDWDLFKKLDLRDALPIRRDLNRGEEAVDDLLSVAGGSALVGARPATPEEILDELLGSHVKTALGAASMSASEDQVLLEAEAGQHEDDTDDLTDDEDLLGWYGNLYSVLGRLRLVDPQKGLRLALLDWLTGDRTYDLVDETDETFKAMEKRASMHCNFVITGHTHMARAMEYSAGRYYFNCGTWIRMIGLTTQALTNEKEFAKLWKTLQTRDMGVLDGAKILGPDGKQDLIVDRTTAVHIEDQGTEVVGNLVQVEGPKNGKVEVSPKQSQPFVVA